MKAIAQTEHAHFVRSDSDSTRFSVGKLIAPLTLAMAVATGATLASLGMDMYTGWQSGGLLIERIIRIVLIGAAGLFVHRLHRNLARFGAVSG